MERITISLNETLAEEFDAWSLAHGYSNRSEAVRDILRKYIETNRVEESRAPDCVANVSYVYNHHEREMAKRVNDIQHEHHDLTISSMHAHLDHENCIETLLLRGKTKDVQACAEQLLAEKGIRHGVINLIPVEVDSKHHDHDHDHDHDHPHIRPKT